jgi:hypothetical protein
MSGISHRRMSRSGSAGMNIWCPGCHGTYPFRARNWSEPGKAPGAHVPQRDVTFEGGPLSFLPSIRTIREHQATFVGWFGWELVFVGGVLVLAGSIIAAIASV